MVLHVYTLSQLGHLIQVVFFPWISNGVRRELKFQMVLPHKSAFSEFNGNVDLVKAITGFSSGYFLFVFVLFISDENG